MNPIKRSSTLKTVSLSLSMTLAGCSSYSNSFDCPIGKGLKCASLSEVNEQLDDGRFQPLGMKDCPGCQKVHWQEDLKVTSRQDPS